MPKIYLINIGANLAHQHQARSPVFDNGNFVYVSFPDEQGGQIYSLVMRPFLSPACPSHTHLDPDWPNKTYGDNCMNPRARALLRAETQDILLFWALLWDNAGNGWNYWTGQKGWYLIGALRIGEILEAGQRIGDAKEANRERAKINAHVNEGQVWKSDGRIDRVFIGDLKDSRLFDKAVDLEIGKNQGLLHKTVRTVQGKEVSWTSSPRWNSVLRSCRAVWDLADAEQRERAELVRDAIQKQNENYDLLSGF